jgi:hypothetical protein
MTARTVLWVYIGLGVLTLMFEFYVRLPVCTPNGDCASSLIKGLFLSVFWPAGWVAYLQGVI